MKKRKHAVPLASEKNVVPEASSCGLHFPPTSQPQLLKHHQRATDSDLLHDSTLETEGQEAGGLPCLQRKRAKLEQNTTSFLTANQILYQQFATFLTHTPRRKRAQAASGTQMGGW